jgi:hypothetical protein
MLVLPLDSKGKEVYVDISSLESRKIIHNSFENVTEVEIFRRARTNHCCTHEEVKSRLNKGNVYEHSVPNILSSRLLTKT